MKHSRRLPNRCCWDSLRSRSVKARQTAIDRSRTSGCRTRLNLPIGIQSFAKLREEGCYYVDKTPYALRLIREGGHYFLSRPRRFGKSLFLDTLKEMFEGNKAMSDGTAVRNSTLSGAYFMIAARAVGLDCGPMSGVDLAKVNAEFFPDGRLQANFLINLGYGDDSKLFDRNPRLSFAQACSVL